MKSADEAVLLELTLATEFETNKKLCFVRLSATHNSNESVWILSAGTVEQRLYVHCRKVKVICVAGSVKHTRQQCGLFAQVRFPIDFFVICLMKLEGNLWATAINASSFRLWTRPCRKSWTNSDDIDCWLLFALFLSVTRHLTFKIWSLRVFSPFWLQWNVFTFWFEKLSTWQKIAKFLNRFDRNVIDFLFEVE